MDKHYTRPRYRRNQVTNRKLLYGRKVRDAVSGWWTYEDKTVDNPAGYRVDATNPRSLDESWDRSDVN